MLIHRNLTYYSHFLRYFRYVYQLYHYQILIVGMQCISLILKNYKSNFLIEFLNIHLENTVIEVTFIIIVLSIKY